MGNRFKVGDLVVARGSVNAWVLGVAIEEIGTVIEWKMLSHSYGPQKRRYYTVLWSSQGLRHGIRSSEILHYAV